jgi:DNA-binding response OmpR family regulator
VLDWVAVPKKPLGQLLVQRGILSPPQLRQALEFQRGSGRRLASECFLRGFAGEARLLATLSEQAGVPGATLGDLLLPLVVLEAVPEVMARKCRLLPVRLDGDCLFVAMADPQDSVTIGEVEFISNRRVVAWVALDAPLGKAIDESYAAKRRGELEYRGERSHAPDAGQAPVGVVYPAELARVPPELLSELSVGGRVGSGSEVVIQVGEDDPGDLIIELGDDEEPSVPPRVAPPARTRHPVVLIVDDDQELRRLMGRVLRSHALEVREAGRGLEALSMIRERLPDLLVLDAMLPEVHGFDICRKLRSSTRYGRLPIVMISSIYRGWRFARDLRESYGVDAFLEKPFKLDQLATVVERILAQRSPQSKHPSPAATELLSQAMAAFKQGDLDSAIERCREGLRIDPLSAALHFRLGVFYLKKQGAIYQALQELEEAVQLDPDLFVAQRSLAILYQRRGFKNKAIEMWERAVQSSPSPEVRDRIRNHLKTLI